MLPTPTSSPGGPSTSGREGGPNLAGAIGQLLPTPTAGLANYDEDPESWTARRDRMIEHGYNGNGAGTPLGLAARMAAEGTLDRLLPTPTATDAVGSRRATARTDEWTSKEGVTLTDIAWQVDSGEPLEQLLPTLTTWDAKNTDGPAQHDRHTPPMTAVVARVTSATPALTSDGSTAPTAPVPGAGARARQRRPTGGRTRPPSNAGKPSASSGTPCNRRSPRSPGLS